MKTYTETKTCLFLVDNLYVIKKVSKAVEYDDSIPGAEEDAEQHVKAWFDSLPQLLAIAPRYGDLKRFHVYGGRVRVTWHFDAWDNGLLVDGIPILLDKDALFKGTIERLVGHLNAIATYGVDDFMKNYRKTMLEEYDRLLALAESITDDTLRDEQKKNLIQWVFTLLPLKIWSPLGKTNEEMSFLAETLDGVIDGHG